MVRDMENISKEIEKIGKKLVRKQFQLTDEDMSSVYGGFAEMGDIPTKGLEIECIKCHTTDPLNFSETVYYDTTQNSVEYHCNACNTSFIVKDGYAIDKPVWLEYCARNSILYKH